MLPFLLLALGIADPFTPPPEAAQRDNAEGFKLYRNREYARARPLFERAVKAAPEYDAARFNLATTYAAEQRWDAALREAEPLLAHNYPRYSHQILTDPDWAPIKVAAREMNALRARLDKSRAAYSAGLDKALLLAARVRPAIDSPVGDQARTFRHTEVYAYDLTSARWRQLTETAGRVVAFVRSPDGRRIAYATQEKSKIVGGVFGRLMQDAQVVELDLKSFEATAPKPLLDDTLAFSMTYAQGALRLAAATPIKSDEQLVVASAGELVVVHATDVVYYPPQGPPLGRLSIPIDPLSITWSPLRNRVLFRRHVPPCSLGKRRGELYLYDPARKQMTRIMSASALFDAVWIADDAFAFEDGLDGKSAIRIWRAGKLMTLKLPHGAGLRSIPELPTCGA